MKIGQPEIPVLRDSKCLTPDTHFSVVGLLCPVTLPTAGDPTLQQQYFFFFLNNSTWKNVRKQQESVANPHENNGPPMSGPPPY